MRDNKNEKVTMEELGRTPDLFFSANTNWSR
jgi:hypothetical protein